MAAASQLVALTTDFGLADPYVGIMKAAMLRRQPGLRLLDLTHAVPPQHIGLAAYWLERASHFTPAGCVHLVVVDPEVGTSRRVLAVRAGEQFFVSPDNGVLQLVLDRSPAFEARSVDPERYLGRAPESATFHGRDVFGPLAADLAAGAVDFEAVGAPVTPVTGPSWGALRDSDGYRGTVVHVDGFGNLLTDLGAEDLRGGTWSIQLCGVELRLRRTYADVADGELVALVNSYGSVEVAVRNGSAARRLGASASTPVFAYQVH